MACPCNSPDCLTDETNEMCCVDCGQSYCSRHRFKCANCGYVVCSACEDAHECIARFRRGSR